MHTTSGCEISFDPLCCFQAAIAGSPSELVKTYGNRIFTIARHLTQSDTDAATILNETFLQICSESHECCGEPDLWLRLVTIAVRAAFSALHKRLGTLPLGYAADCSGDLVVRELSVWRNDLEQLDTTCVLETGLSHLDPMARTVFVLRDLEEISIERIAAMLNRSVAAIEVCLLRARLQLREDLAPHMRLPQ